MMSLWAKKSLLAGSTADDEDVSGTITVPEVSHELEEDEFQVGVLSLR
jgi:hypothetical protein